MTICCYRDSPAGRPALETDGETPTGVRWPGTGERAATVRLPPALESAVLH